MERGVLYGVATRSQSPVIVDPFDASLENANLAVFAMAGAGKSYFVKLMALRNLLPASTSWWSTRRTSTARCARRPTASTSAWPAPRRTT